MPAQPIQFPELLGAVHQPRGVVITWSSYGFHHRGRLFTILEACKSLLLMMTCHFSFAVVPKESRAPPMWVCANDARTR